MSAEPSKISIDHRKLMTEWQEQKGSVCERDAFILDNQMWTDVTVVVGDMKKEYECHRLYLAKASPQFAKLVKMDSKVDLSDEEMKIFLPDLEPKVFDLILNYIYRDLTALHNGSEILGLLKAIEKYELPIHFIEITEKIVMESQFTDEPPRKFRKFFKQVKTKTKIFKCHKLMLAKTSPVFAAMLYSGFSKDEEQITIPDVTVKAFELFIRYVYQGILPVDFFAWISSGEIWNFLYLAKKYLLPERVLDQCRAWIFSRIYSNNFWNIMSHTKEFGEPKLAETCMKVLQCHTRLCLQASSFKTHASLRLMKKLVKSPTLSIPELTLYQKCVHWARLRLDSDAAQEELRSLLNPLLKHIRFRAIPPHEFTQNVYRTDKFVSHPQLLRFIVDPDCESPLPGFSTELARGRPNISSLYLYGCKPEDMFFNTLVDTTYSIFIHHEAFSLPVKNHCWLIGIKIPTQAKPRGGKAEYYQEHLTVYVHAQDRRDRVLHKTTFSGMVEYNSMLDLDFNVPLDMCLFPDVISAVITIIPHISGRYPYKERTKPYDIWGKFNTQCLIKRTCIKLLGGVGGAFIKCNAYACNKFVSSIFKQRDHDCKHVAEHYNCKRRWDSDYDSDIDSDSFMW
ncbi:hypothetical protein B566_EDAN014956 [Ephemera danica]|nr:hypothetical protein B566_EDAN014956 [Ephemera danica]